jgi:hypothetical protein
MRRLLHQDTQGRETEHNESRINNEKMKKEEEARTQEPVTIIQRGRRGG